MLIPTFCLKYALLYFPGKEKGSKRVLVFGTEESVEKLACSPDLYVDGQFSHGEKQLPDILKQLYTLLGKFSHLYCGIMAKCILHIFKKLNAYKL